MLIGLPGCGKSTLCEKLKESHNIVSTDALRIELCDNVNEQSSNDLVFNEARKRIIRSLNASENVVFDATNVNRKYRIKFLNDIKSQKKQDVDVKYIALWVAVPYETVIERNNSRSRVVSKDVIKKMYLNFSPPGIDEGFDEIMVDFADSDHSKYTVDDFLQIADPFDQKNHHHTLTLGGHCRKCAEYIKQHSDSKLLYDTAMIHDCGKPFTKYPKYDKDGNRTGEYSYHQHHCTGSYDAVFYLNNSGYSLNECIYGSRLVWWHMHPLLEWKSEKKMKKDKEILEENFYNDLVLLNQGDVNAH